MAEVGEPSDDAADLGTVGDPAAEVEAEVGQRGGPHLAGGQGHTWSTQPLAGLLDRSPRHVPRDGDTAAVVAAAAVRRTGVVELLTQEPHPAAVRADVGQHGRLLVPTSRGHPVVAVLVVGPVLAGGRPPAAHAPDRSVDVEHLQHRLQPGAAQVDLRLQGRGRHRPIRIGERAQRGADVLLGRERQRGEVAPHVAVLMGRQEHHVGPVGAASGTADLLVVGDG